MNLGKDVFSAGMQAGMELCWRYAWANYTVLALVDRPFPLPQATGAFLAGALLTSFCRGRGWRVVWIVGLQAVGLCGAVLTVVYGAHDFSLPIWNGRWIAGFFGRPRAFQGWLILSIVCFWAVSFWTGGVSLGRRRRTYLEACARFDWGVAYFAGLFLLRWAIRSKGGIETGNASSDLLLFPYFIFSLFAVGILRCGGEGKKDFLPGSPWAGLMLVSLLGLLFVGTAVALLFLPYLNAAAEMGYAVVRSGAEPLVPLLVSVLRFILLSPASRQGTPYGPSPASGPGAGGAAAESAWWGQSFETYVRYGIEALFVFLWLAAFLAGAWFLVRWLLSKTPGAKDRRNDESGLLERLQSFLAVFRLLFGGAVLLLSRRKSPLTAAGLYRLLRKWGRRSGLPCAPSETPMEYAHRLKKRFPDLKNEVENIVSLFNLEVYGGRVFQTGELAQGRIASRRLRHPRFWGARLRSLLFVPANR